MERGLRRLFVAEHLLVELLARTEARELDFDVLGTAEQNHSFGQVGNLHGLAHVEDEYLAAVALRASFEHQLAGLGDEHEEADDIRVGDGDGSALLDLLLEEGNDAAVAAQHVAEAGGDKLGAAFHFAVLDGFVEALNVDFADTLRTAHDVGGIDGLVGGNHYELLDAVFHR